MEDLENIDTNIIDYVRRNLKFEPNSPKHAIDMAKEKLDGLSNLNYHVAISDKTTNEIIHHIVYRKFGEISEIVDRDLETLIINFLAEQGIGPKIYERDPKMKFRIDEFLVDTYPMTNASIFEPNVLAEVIRIFVLYSTISYVYDYKSISDPQSGKHSIFMNVMKGQNREGCPIVRQNMFDLCMKDMYLKALKEWERFAEQFKANITAKSNKVEHEKYEKYDYYMKNFQALFSKTFPQSGYMVLSHNDAHRLNIIVNQQTDKLYLLDHEYASLNLVGLDIVNYSNEAVLNYAPYYFYTPEKIDYDTYLKVYDTFIVEFQKAHQPLFETQQGKELLNEIKKKEYFFNLISITNLFWLLFASVYLSWSDYSQGTGFKYFEFGRDRIDLFERAEIEKSKLMKK